MMDDYGFTLPPMYIESSGLPEIHSYPAASKERTLGAGVTYLTALHRGDPLLCLPKKTRSCIFAYILSNYPELRYLEVPDTKDFPYPCHTQFSDPWYIETCEILIKNTTFSINSDAAIFNFMVFLTEFKPHESFENVLSLELTSLNLFEKDVFSSNATKLLKRCFSIRSLSLIVDMKELCWASSHGCQELDMDAMTEKYDLMVISQLKQLRDVTINLQPFMSLHKRLAEMESVRKEAELLGRVAPGPGSFWGLKEWLEFQALNQMRLLNVRCPGIVIATTTS